MSKNKEDKKEKIMKKRGQACWWQIRYIDLSLCIWWLGINTSETNNNGGEYTGYPPCRWILTASSISADLSCVLTSGTFNDDKSSPVLFPNSVSLLSIWPAVSTGKMQRTKLTLVFRMASKIVSCDERKAKWKGFCDTLCGQGSNKPINE